VKKEDVQFKRNQKKNKKWSKKFPHGWLIFLMVSFWIFWWSCCSM